jgi:hypothetical protein
MQAPPHARLRQQDVLVAKLLAQSFNVGAQDALKLPSLSRSSSSNKAGRTCSPQLDGIFLITSRCFIKC